MCSLYKEVSLYRDSFSYILRLLESFAIMRTLLYRGSLHRVSSVLRSYWLRPTLSKGNYWLLQPICVFIYQSYVQIRFHQLEQYNSFTAYRFDCSLWIENGYQDRSPSSWSIWYDNMISYWTLLAPPLPPPPPLPLFPSSSHSFSLLSALQCLITTTCRTRSPNLQLLLVLL